MLEFKFYVTHKTMGHSRDEITLIAEGHRVQNLLTDPKVLGVMILQPETELTVQRVKRLERMLGSIFGEKLTLIY